MLLAERRGASYNKKEHNRRLQRLLNDRSSGAIERKHMNISAILHEVGFPAEAPAVGAGAWARFEAPPPRKTSPRAVHDGPWAPRGRSPVPTIDYLEREARNRALGEGGESFVIRFEQARLERAGQDRLAGTTVA